MTLDLTSKQEAIILQIAQDEREMALLSERIAEADQGIDWVLEAEMDERVRTMLCRAS